MSWENLISPEVYRRLSTLRRVLRLHLVGRGLCLLVVAMVVAVFLTLAIDYPLRLDRAQRLVILAMVLCGVGYVLWRFLVRPLRVPMGPEELALVFESRYPHLDDRLISLLQFGTRPSSRAGASEAMIRKLAEEANALARRLAVRDVVESAGTWKRAGWLAGALAVLAVFSIWKAPIMGPWFMRNVLLADLPYPRQTYLTVHGGPEFRVVRGGHLSVRVTAEGVVPPAVTFHMRFPGLGKVEQNVPAAGPGQGNYTKTFQNVSDAFEFYVTGNDDRSGLCRVTVVSPPELVALRGLKRSPGYMNRPADEPFQAEQGIIPVPPGTQLFLVGQANKDLSSARLLLDGKPAATMRIRSVRPPGNTPGPPAPRGIEGALQLPERIKRATMVLQFELTDTEGIRNPRGAVYTLRIVPDGPPKVSMNRRYVRGEVTARATIPLVLKAADDYGVAALAVRATAATAGQAATRPAAREFPITAHPDIQARRRSVQADFALDLAPLKLQVGQLVHLQAVARDTLPESFGGPNLARSPVQTFKIVSEEQLLAELIRRQKEIRLDFAACVEHQGRLRDKMRALADSVRARGVDVETGRTLRLLAAGQRQVAGRCAVIAQRLEGVVHEMEANHLSPAERARLARRVVTPLRQVAKKPMAEAISQIDRASKMTDTAAIRKFTANSADVLESFYQRLEAILKQMKELESRQELASQLKMIIDISEDVYKLISKELKRQTGHLFDPRTRPAPQSPPAGR